MKHKLFLGAILFLVCIAMLGVGGCGSSSSSCATALIATTSGNVCGSVIHLAAGPSLSQNVDVETFRGIPYAQPPLGSLRFLPPVAKTRSAGTIDATAFGPVCPQTGAVPAFFTLVNGTSEDCLTLNVWKPATANAENTLPVMLWIHGGEYVRHGSGENGWDGRMLAARENVVVVSLNYRLGALGLLYDSADGINGNMSLKDQQLSMTWVQDNIQQFGGDPSKVTLFGWSAGAISVTAHTLSIPSSRSTTFFRAILSQSNVLGDTLKSSGDAAVTTQANSIRSAVCPGISAGSALSCLQSASVADILTAQANAGTFFPVIDGSFVTRQAITGASAGLLNIPAVIGTVQNEGNLFVAQETNSTFLSASDYQTKVNTLFGATNAAKVLAHAPYIPTVGGNNTTQYQSVQTDYLFGCPARYLATKASSSIFIYAMQQVPNENVNWNHTVDPDCTGAVCLACNNALCHGDDLPFTWNSVYTVNTTAPIPGTLLTTFSATQQNLANAMQDFWGNFAKNLNPGTASGQTWPSFATQGDYQIFGCQGEGCLQNFSTTTTVPYTDCTNFWDTQIGYEGLAPGA